MQDVTGARIEMEAFPPGSVEIARLTGTEAISRIFELEILVVCRDVSGLEIDELVGAEATLVFERDGAETRRVHGMISVAHDRLDTETVHSSYRLTFVPRAYRLSLVEICDVFLDTPLPDILRKKLRDAGMEEGKDFELRLYDTYAPREFVVQYKESDLAFLSRLTEHVGVSFFFEHRGGRDVMVFTDGNAGFRPIVGKRQVPCRIRGDRRDIYALAETVRMIPGQYVVQDYNYRTPQVELTGRASVPTGVGGVVEYGAHVKSPEEADKLAQIRAQERLAGRRVFEGRSDVERLAAGATLELQDHPRGDLELLITELTHDLTQVTLGTAGGAEGGYHNEITAILAKRQYRPARRTAKPRISGVINGIIDAENPGQYAEMDDQGRYRVKFMFDTTGPDAGKGSRLVRMAQPHSGPGYGFHFPLRPGVEVIVTFVDGDPDRPIIAATVPNPRTASPVASGNAPKNIIRTGAGNEIAIDDTHDSHRIKLSTPHKNTVFQLGAPNSPESGAMLETWGAASNVAMAGMTGFSSAGAIIKAFGELSEAGDITTLAKPLDFPAVAGSVSEIIQSLAEIGSSICEVILGVMKTLAKKKRQLAVAQQMIAKRKREALTESRKKTDEDLDAKITALAGSTDASDVALRTALSNYKAALAQYRTDQTAYLFAEEYYVDLQKGEKDGTYTGSLDGQKALRDAAFDTIEDRSGEKRATPGVAAAAQTTASSDGSKKRLEDALAALQTAITAKKNAAGTSDEEKAELTELGTEAGEASAAETEYTEAQDLACERRHQADEADEEIEKGEDGPKIEEAKKIFEAAKMGTSVLFSVITLAYGLVRWIWEKLKGAEEEIELELSLVGCERREHVDPFQHVPTGFFVKAARRHTMGSTGSTVVYGEKNLFAFSDNAVLRGRKAATVMSDEHLGLHSADTAELSAGHSLKLTSWTIDALSDGPYKVKAIAGGGGLGTISAEASDAIDVTSKKGNIQIQAKSQAGQNIRVEAKNTLFGGADFVTFNAAKQAQMLSGSSKLFIDGDAGAITLGNPAWKLSIKDAEIKLGTTQNGLLVKSEGPTISSGPSMVKVTTGKVTMKAAGVVAIEGDIVQATGRCLLG